MRTAHLRFRALCSKCTLSQVIKIWYLSFTGLNFTVDVREAYLQLAVGTMISVMPPLYLLSWIVLLLTAKSKRNKFELESLTAG